jgi:hypothetical protein
MRVSDETPAARIFDPDREIWIDRAAGETDAEALYRARYGRPMPDHVRNRRPQTAEERRLGALLTMQTFYLVPLILVFAAAAVSIVATSTGPAAVLIDVITIVVWGAATAVLVRGFIRSVRTAFRRSRGDS